MAGLASFAKFSMCLTRCQMGFSLKIDIEQVATFSNLVTAGFVEFDHPVGEREGPPEFPEAVQGTVELCREGCLLAEKT